jgi:16S rRNA processing protein RimM
MEPVVLGRIGAPHGVRGRVRVQSFARPPESILEFSEWWLDAGAGWQTYAVRASEIQSRQIVVALGGCADREAAAALRHASIAVPRAALPALESGDHYWLDLIGLRVETADGIELGRVDHLLETGANDVLVVRGDRERLIPWSPRDFVLEVDIAAGRMVVDWDPDF